MKQTTTHHQAIAKLMQSTMCWNVYVGVCFQDQGPQVLVATYFVVATSLIFPSPMLCHRREGRIVTVKLCRTSEVLKAWKVNISPASIVLCIGSLIALYALPVWNGSGKGAPFMPQSPSKAGCSISSSYGMPIYKSVGQWIYIIKCSYCLT